MEEEEALQRIIEKGDKRSIQTNVIKGNRTVVKYENKANKIKRKKGNKR